MEWFEELGIDMDTVDTSFSVSLDKGEGCEWGSRNGLTSLFAQKKNALSLHFLKMLQEIHKFKNDVLDYIKVYEDNAAVDTQKSLGDFFKWRGYSELFLNCYVVPICCSIWFCSPEQVLTFSAFRALKFLNNHHLLQLFGGSQWHTMKGGSFLFVNKMKEKLEARDCLIQTNCIVNSISTCDGGCKIFFNDGSYDIYDGCIMAIQAPDAMKVLGEEATYEEARILGAFQYRNCDVFLHQDKSLMPQSPAAWSARNFLQNAKNIGSLTYWLNGLQNINASSLPFFVTINPSHGPDTNFLNWSIGNPIPTCAAAKASSELDCIQGRRRIWFCGKYQGCGSSQDGLKAGLFAARGILGRSYAVLKNSKGMPPSFLETAARFLVIGFLKRFVTAGCILLEDGVSVLRFQGSHEKCPLKVALRVHSAQFYWKFATRGDLGVADAYTDGDFSISDKNEGLLNLFQIFIANSYGSTVHEKRGWWWPVLLTTSVATVRYVHHHASRKNTLAQARRNIAYHYDLSNEMFGLFLDETMTYSCGVFKFPDEHLKDAQLRKFSVFVKKAKIMENHEVLEIGCGWGGLAIEVVKQTGCKYTAINISEKQLMFAEQRVKEAGLQDRIKFLLCDYRQLPPTKKYDRILACEMIEHVGHEYCEEFFSCCDSILAENGLLILQFSSIPDPLFHEFRRSPGFVKEFIFPGAYLPSLSRVTAAMAASSRLSVEHVENIGIHYYKTLRCWRMNFLEHQTKILSLGFDEKFIRKWEYYLDYCAAGFKTHTLGNYQIVLSRYGNNVAFNDPFEGILSALSY